MSKLAPMSGPEEELQSKVDSLTRDLDHQKMLVLVAREEREAALGTSRRLVGEMQGLVDERAHAATALAEFGKVIKRYQSELATEKDERERAQRFVSELREQLAAARERADRAAGYRSADPEALTAERDRLLARVQELGRMLDNGTASFESLRQRENRLGVKVATMQRSINALTREVGVARRILGELAEKQSDIGGINLNALDNAIATAIASLET
jgi:chromosome segregation ATPase